MEQDDSGGIIVVATNHPQILDRALFRRFDYMVEYGLPSEDVAERMLRSRLSLLRDSKVDWNGAIEVARGLSHSDLTRACEHVAKNAILRFRAHVETAELEDALKEHRRQFGKS